MVAAGIDVAVRDLGYRWGSTKGSSYINIHWATLQLAPNLIDYVIVHELAHLRELNHTGRYWSEVERVMADYDRRRDELATAGMKIWTCRSAGKRPRSGSACDRAARAHRTKRTTANGGAPRHRCPAAPEVTQG